MPHRERHPVTAALQKVAAQQKTQHKAAQQKSHQPAQPRAVVVGGGVAGLVAARELARQGLDVAVLEASAAFGGCVARHEVAGLMLDAGAESFATRSSVVADLAGELGLGGSIVAPNPAGAWLQLPESAQPLPKTSVVGIPADPAGADIVKAIGRRASLRAAADKVLPLGTLLRKEPLSLGELVRTRMGSAVLERLVTPVAAGVYSADPDVLDVDSVVPGLRAAVVRHGSLGAAVGALRGAAPAGAAVAGIAGGMGLLVEHLVKDLKDRGVRLYTDAKVSGLERRDGGWRVASAAGDFSPAGLVVATDGVSAVRLLAGSLPGLEAAEPAPGPAVALVTLVVDLPELDAAPRGTGLLVAPGVAGVRAKALTHATAKWPWLAAEAGPGNHVLRLSYGRAAGQHAPEAEAFEDFTSWPDEQLCAQALADASVLLGLPIGEDDVLGRKVVRWVGALPSATLGHRARVAEVRRLASGQHGLQLAGAWLAGTGLAAVVGDARQRARLLAEDLGAGTAPEGAPADSP
ncbi:protoporphyrinogen oxidase [Arthrobacter mobilis]|uniref:Coproporphyrinogen III oxidase n=1 Tax=Arthrobacter mobilis TaxID=2724944 RepID=A0A7X6HCT5_9MICC|nr:protoporphyrinogen oxidase [Arthrobacter mobilis]NKX53778.1 protoporphyrinogen oxidase [Arthrobacter mobilis]